LRPIPSQQEGTPHAIRDFCAPVSLAPRGHSTTRRVPSWSAFIPSLRVRRSQRSGGRRVSGVRAQARGGIPEQPLSCGRAEADLVVPTCQVGSSENSPKRPLHHRTFERLCDEAEKAELPYQWRVMTRLQGLLEKSGLLPSTESDQPDQEQVMKGVQQALERPELLRQTRGARGRGRTKNSRSPGARRRRG
jgi:hypothetical protein